MLSGKVICLNPVFLKIKKEPALVVAIVDQLPVVLTNGAITAPIPIDFRMRLTCPALEHRQERFPVKWQGLLPKIRMLVRVFHASHFEKGRKEIDNVPHLVSSTSRLNPLRPPCYQRSRDASFMAVLLEAAKGSVLCRGPSWTHV